MSPSDHDFQRNVSGTGCTAKTSKGCSCNRICDSGHHFCPHHIAIFQGKEHEARLREKKKLDDDYERRRNNR